MYHRGGEKDLQDIRQGFPVGWLSSKSFPRACLAGATLLNTSGVPEALSFRTAPGPRRTGAAARSGLTLDPGKGKRQLRS